MQYTVLGGNPPLSDLWPDIITLLFAIVARYIPFDARFDIYIQVG